jgi:hypothetical protein
MKRIMQFLAAMIPVAFTAAICQWDQRPQLIAAVVITVSTLALFLLFLFLRSRVHTPEKTSRKPRPTSRSPIVYLSLAFLQGSIFACVLAVLVPPFSHLPPLQRLGLDVDRRAMELSLVELESAASWQDAVSTIESRLKQPLTETWARELRRRLYDNLIQAARTTNGDTAKAYAERAREIAAIDGNSDVAAEFILTSVLERAEADRFKSSMAHYHFDTLVAWGDSLSFDPAAQIHKYRDAESFGIKRKLDTTVLSKRIDSATRAAKVREAIDLPTGTHIVLRSRGVDRGPPVSLIEVSILNGNGASITGLTAKDFKAEIDGKPAVPLHVAELAAKANKFSVVVLLDQSASTAGEPLIAAKAGIVSLTTSLEGVANVKAYSFSSDVKQLSEWGATSSQLAASVSAIRANGHTALFAAIETAANDLLRRPAPRHIVVFTDGQNTVPGVELPALVSRCQQQGIQINVVGLEGEGLDRPTLTQLATSTSGLMVMAARANELEQRFNSVSEQLTAPRYRIAIPCHESRQIRLRVGKANAVELIIP